MANPRYIVLNAIVDTFVAPLEKAEIEECEDYYFKTVRKEFELQDTIRMKFYNFQPSKDIDKLAEYCLEYITVAIPTEKLNPILMVFDFLSTRMGTFVLTGFMTPFPELCLRDRAKALRTLEKSWLEALRVLYRALYLISVINAYGASSDHPQWGALQYSRDSLRDVSNANTLWRPKFISPISDTIEYDIVVVGSGCGGGLVAAELSKEGYKVLLCDKAAYQHHTEYVMEERKGVLNTFDFGGGFQSENGAISVMNGSNWGGGSTVNWSASFQPPNKLREEWKRDYGLEHITAEEFQKGVDICWQRIGCTTKNLNHDVQNQILIDGCKTAGYPCVDVDQNTSGVEHNCGFCTLGCPSGVKNSSSVTWIKDAALNGCQFLSGFQVAEVLHNNGRASGVVGMLHGKLFTVNAKRAVVLSAGSIRTPAILLRSQLPNLNPHIGKHLRLHPVATCFGIFPQKLTKPHEGSILTAVSSHLDEEGYGFKLETPVGHPSIFSLMLPWRNPAQHKKRMLLWPHTSSIIVLTRDKDSEGQIYVGKNRLNLDSKKEPRLIWNLGKQDEVAMVEGIIASAKVFLAAGAIEVWTNQFEIAPFIRPKSSNYQDVIDSPEFLDYVKLIKATGVKPGNSVVLSAHQMGSCRMSSNPKKGAVGPNGKVYGTSKLYLADASVFPTASGVNPMVTTYSMAYSIAQGIKNDLSKSAKL